MLTDMEWIRSQRVISFLFLAAFANANLANEYDHAAYLDPEENYKLYWSVEDADKSIHFAVEVNTTGWVGFGISAGLTGNMKSADMVVGWVDSQGKGNLQDYHGQEAKNGWPILDKNQDYNLVGSYESNGVTVLKFNRKIITCDREDRDIPIVTGKVIYAFGNDDVLNYHSSNRGARSLNFLSYVKNVPPPKTAKHFDALTRSVLVPAVHTTYWCQALKLADLVTLSKKQHIIEVEPIIDKKDRGVVHHIIVYACKDSFNETHLNVTGSCYKNRNMPPSIRECVGSSPMFGWAVGGVNFKFPDHVGWPIGAKDSMKYVVLETHFDNPTMKSDWLVTSGLRFYYDTPRKYDAATLTVGTATSISLTIPPKQENWVASGACMRSCTLKINESVAPGGEIKFFASTPHSHTAGRGIWTKIVRGGKEITEIIRDDNYDFDYQGDEAINYCRYNTMARKDATIGGLATKDEMCLNFILYYPRVDLSLCITGDLRVGRDISKKYGNLATRENTTYFKDWTGVVWNKTMVDELKALYAYQGKDAIYSVCRGGSGNRHPVTLEYRPTIKEPLPPKKHVCTEGVSIASVPVASYIILPFVVIFATFGLSRA